MQQQHPKEPWAVVDVCQGYCNVRANDGALVAEGLPMPLAKRIVACVNAFEGVETGDIETSVARFIAANTKRSADLRNQRDRLLGTLRDVDAYLGQQPMPVRSSNGPHYVDQERLRQASELAYQVKAAINTPTIVTTGDNNHAA